MATFLMSVQYVGIQTNGGGSIVSTRLIWLGIAALIALFWWGVYILLA